MPANSRAESAGSGDSSAAVVACNANLQTLLTPNWMGVLGSLSTGRWIVATIFTWVAFGWLGRVLVFLYGLVLAALTDVVSPFPTYRHCFDVIESALRFGPDDPAVEDLLDKVRAIRSRHGH
jgi:hypothetical protein